MTAQEVKVNKGLVKYINWNSVITAICTGAILWMGSGIRGMYNDLKKQPYVDEKQNTEISSLKTEVSNLKSEHEKVKNEQTRLGGKVIYLEAILPDSKQFKIKRDGN